MKHSNISIFIPHLGCKHLCSFCNQNVITKSVKATPIEQIEQTLAQSYENIIDKKNTEIAFFGGSFTAVPHEYMIKMLELANKFLGPNGFAGIRISTRPDNIDEEILALLKSYGVTSIELGAQSMINEVLDANKRGHTKKDVEVASNLIKEHDFSLGLQMMVGLYKDTVERCYETANAIINIKPDTVRIYPAVIIKDTLLHDFYESGDYKPFSLEQGIEICADLLEMFKQSNIKVIKMGLHSSVDVEKSMVGGIYHPAFKELCESRIFFNRILNLIKKEQYSQFVILVSPKDVSKVIGQNKENIIKLKQLGFNCRVIQDESIIKDDIKVLKDV